MTTDAVMAPIEQAVQQGALMRAERLARRALQEYPGDGRLLSMLGRIQGHQGRYAEAEVNLRAALERNPLDAEAHNSLGVVLNESGDRGGAEIQFQRAAEIDPMRADALSNLIALRMAREDNPGALAAIDQLLKADPGALRPRLLRVDVLRNTQTGPELAAEYRRVIADHPRAGWPWYGLANLKSVPLETADVAVMQRLVSEGQFEAQERAALGFALGKALEDVGRYAEAFGSFAEANANVRRRVPWQADAFSTQLDATLAASAAIPPRPSDVGRDCIFLVSLPRAGSTLLEQMLASHSRIHGGGEILHLENVLGEESRRRGKDFAHWFAAATPSDWERLGKDYLARTESLHAGGRISTDKKLDNWRFVGAILAMLPQARVINCRRDPVETGLSCFKQLFPTGSELYSYDLTDIGRYFRDYERACRKWNESFPDRFLDIRYEDLLADAEAGLRRVLAFCGLDYEPACLKFYENRRSIVTISAAQVREPLRRDTARAAKYGALLDPLRTALGLPPHNGPDE